MVKLIPSCVAIALVFYSISGLVPLKYSPHSHLLFGYVTAEQLQAHEAAESLERLDLSTPPYPALDPSRSSTSGNAGVIISVASGLASLISTLHFEIASGVLLVLLIDLVYRTVSLLSPLRQTLPLRSPDPPPRAVSPRNYCNPHMIRFAAPNAA